MNYEKIILELMSRIQNLEEIVGLHEKRLALIDDCDENLDVDPGEAEEVSNQERYKRTDARDEAIRILSEKFPDHKVKKALREDGSGINMVDQETNDKLTIKFYFSKMAHNRTQGYEYGYYLVRLKELARVNPKFCLFSMIDSNDELSFIVLENEEMFKSYYEREHNEDDELQLYIRIQGDSAVVSFNDGSEEVIKLGNWDIIK